MQNIMAHAPQWNERRFENGMQNPWRSASLYQLHEQISEWKAVK